MKKKSTLWLAIAVFASFTLLVLGVAAQTSSDKSEAGPSPGDSQSFSLADIKTLLHASDEEWKVIGPKLRRVMAAHAVVETRINESGAGSFGFMAMGPGGFDGFGGGPPSGPGFGNDSFSGPGDSGAFGRGGPGFGGPPGMDGFGGGGMRGGLMGGETPNALTQEQMTKINEAVRPDMAALTRKLADAQKEAINAALDKNPTEKSIKARIDAVTKIQSEIALLRFTKGIQGMAFTDQQRTFMEAFSSRAYQQLFDNGDSSGTGGFGIRGRGGRGRGGLGGEDSGAPNMGEMMGGGTAFGGRGMGGPPGFGGPGMGGPPGSGGAGNNAVMQKLTELQKTLADPQAAPEQLKGNIDAVRKERKKAKAELEAAQKDLRQLLASDQEAILIALGYLD